MKILVCDDNEYFLDFFIEKAEKILSGMGVKAEWKGCRCGEELLAELQRETDTRTDAVFLDIDMPGLTGFEIAQAAGEPENRPLIVFVSSMDHLVYDSFEYQPFWFLKKSDLDRLPEILEKLVQQVRRQRRFYSFQREGKKVNLPLNEILYFENRNHNVLIYTDTEVWNHRESIGRIAEQLEDCFFVRCHVGFLVNCRHIALIESGRLKLRAGQVIPVSRKRQKETERRFMEYMRSVRL